MSIIEILKVIVFGIVEGFTEWLPISSTGHLILVEELIHLNVTEAFFEVFLVVIQLGAILAVMVLYFRKLNPWDGHKTASQQRATFRLWLKIVVACIPAVIFGLLLDDWIDARLHNGFVTSAMLILYGIFFIVLENRNRYKEFPIQRVTQISYQAAFYIGLIQVLSLIPGTSRSGVTILGAMLLGCARGAATEFTFFLGIPIMFGASFLKIVKYALKNQRVYLFTGTETFYLVLGMLTAFVVSVYSIRFLMGYIKRNDFKFFGYYRVIFGTVAMAFFIVQAVLNSMAQAI